MLMLISSVSKKYQFGYPVEYKIAEIISTEDTYGQILAIMAEMMKRFRLGFQKDRKKQVEQRRKKAARKKAA